MQTRTFPATQTPVSEVGVGTWQLGGAEWGDVSEQDALACLRAAADAGTTFIDTADIYGLGRSESLIGKFLKERDDRERFFIATKLGRHPDPGWPDNFTKATITAHTEASLKRLGVEALDLTQTHCIPEEVMREGEVWQHLRDLQAAGKIKAFGASVESMDEALLCLEQEDMASLQIIFNIFRQKPIDVLFEKAKEKGVALIIRLPLASGLLAGKFTKQSTFGEKDHRNFNRDGQAFNAGETFAGLPFELGVDLANELKAMLPAEPQATMAQWALRWCLDFEAVTTVIPGASKPQQAADNAAASELPRLSDELHERLKSFYGESVKDNIRGKY